MTALDPRQVAKAFGAILRGARVAAGVSQEILEERADCDRTYPSRQRGLRQPTIGRLIAIADAFRIELGTLVTLTVARLRTEAVLNWPRDRQ